MCERSHPLVHLQWYSVLCSVIFILQRTLITVYILCMYTCTVHIHVQCTCIVVQCVLSILYYKYMYDNDYCPYVYRYMYSTYTM